MAKYFAKQPLASRRRTIELAFNTGHLQIHRECTARHAQQLDDVYEDDTLALLIAVEHLSMREIESVQLGEGKPGRTFRFSVQGEVMTWCLGPSSGVMKAVRIAVKLRMLERVIMACGAGFPDTSRVPTYSSFGGIGTCYHNALLPTTSMISGPWSLWVPKFDGAGVDAVRLRSQALALGTCIWRLRIYRERTLRVVLWSIGREARMTQEPPHRWSRMRLLLPPTILNLNLLNVFGNCSSVSRSFYSQSIEATRQSSR
jgi:hypothetical protein